MAFDKASHVAVTIFKVNIFAPELQIMSKKKTFFYSVRGIINIMKASVNWTQKMYGSKRNFDDETITAGRIGLQVIQMAARA